MRTRLQRIFSILLMLLVFSLSLLTTIFMARADSVRHWEAAPLSREHENATPDHTIYGDSLASGWMNCSWGSKINFANSSPRYSGDGAISFTATRSWGALCLSTKTAVHTTPQSYLGFAAQASQAGQTYSVRLFDSYKYRRVARRLATFTLNPPVGTWKVYSIPLSDLSTNATQMRGVVIQSRTALPQPALYVAAISMNDAVSPTSTATVTPTPAFTPTPNLDPPSTLTPTSNVGPTPTFTPTPNLDPPSTLTPTSNVGPTPTFTPTPNLGPTPANVPPPATGGNCQGMSIAAYWPPTYLGWWDKIDASYPASRTLTADVNNGPGTTVNSAYASGITKAKQAGIRVFGYVYTSWGYRDPAAVKADIDQWKNLYGVTDVMFDEGDWRDGTRVAYYQDLYAYVHRTPGALVELNSANYITEGYTTASDIWAVYESTYNAYMNMQPPSWVYKYPATKFKAYIYGTPNTSVIPSILQKLKKDNIAYFDITDSTKQWSELATDTFWNALVPAVASAC